MLADMATEIDAARLLTYRAAFLKQAGKNCSKEAAMAKMYASDAAMKITVDAVQIRWLWLQPRISGGASDAECQNNLNIRRHQSGAAYGHFRFDFTLVRGG